MANAPYLARAHAQGLSGLWTLDSGQRSIVFANGSASHAALRVGFCAHHHLASYRKARSLCNAGWGPLAEEHCLSTVRRVKGMG
jgi:hypothetical protein